MKITLNKLENLIKEGLHYLDQSSENELTFKIAVDKWSKKEVLGHLVDSAINNLQRFTEIQFEKKPFKIKKYNQDELVKSNNYQNVNAKDLIELWHYLNKQIINVMTQQTELTLNYKIDLGENNISDLRFLMTDYVNHLEHHLNQIIKK